MIFTGNEILFLLTILSGIVNILYRKLQIKTYQTLIQFGNIRFQEINYFIRYYVFLQPLQSNFRVIGF
jgi:hypothetical protein